MNWQLLTWMAAEAFIPASALLGVITWDRIRERARVRRDDPWR